MSREILLSAKGICKTFGPTRALVDADIDIYKGEVRGLIGENGSGKSTFSNIVAGALKNDSGSLEMNGVRYEPKNMVDAQNKHVSMIVQETGVIPRITVSANIFTGRLEQFTKAGFLSIKKLNEAANKALDDIGAPEIRGEMYIDMLNFEDKKIVEIARAMSTNPDLLIIDETTTALATKGRAIIYNLMKRMRSKGKSVIFIGHDLTELMEVCDSITVLRDGVVIQTLFDDDISIENMRILMVGRELVGHFYREDFIGTYEKEVVLEAKQISLRPYFKNIDIKLHKGEILGLGGLSDCGMHELGKVLFGFEKSLTGSVRLTSDGTIIDDCTTAVSKGLAYVSKDRDKESIIQSSTIKSNMILPSLQRISKALGFISPRTEAAITNNGIKALRVKCRDGNQLIRELSGGNKQKVVFSKWIEADADIFILDCPTRGIDIGVKKDMYSLLMDMKNKGKSIIMISEELPELLGMSDRVLFMKNGEISHEAMRSEEMNEQNVIQYII